MLVGTLLQQVSVQPHATAQVPITRSRPRSRDRDSCRRRRRRSRRQQRHLLRSPTVTACDRAAAEETRPSHAALKFSDTNQVLETSESELVLLFPEVVHHEYTAVLPG